MQITDVPRKLQWKLNYALNWVDFTVDRCKNMSFVISRTQVLPFVVEVCVQQMMCYDVCRETNKWEPWEDDGRNYWKRKQVKNMGMKDKIVSQKVFR